ncbi:hypothetical protein CAI21_02320 [Alkalilimnicola ehrlichii]|uniref:LrgB family protein n=1 Tax=Alkalilimnicola ehrlichii TaxID=351052 RepID=A0A3E0X3L4_9GAMM|nr:LrgB family protein [Alkalilimnicola ehrlichii]RFA31464.1 hypothetical protein CAI21_02320 [Alkalilimnicola ehrlichii]RFA39265.1 hypothetical protein CAL65_00070 [Alkalilimnicola ehrlichii]
MIDSALDFWLWLQDGPLLGILLTVLAYQLGLWINRCAGGTPVLHPVIIAIALLIGLLLLADIPYRDYFAGAQFIHFLLGPATVALAVPLFDHKEQIRRLALPLLVACTVGVVTAVGSTLLLAWLLGARVETMLSLAPKSVTTPIAIGISEQIGGIPSVAAGMVLIAGAIGCILGPILFRLFKIREHEVQGFTMGLAAHGFGTAQSFGISHQAGAFAGLALGMAGLLTAFLLPLLVRLLGL